MCGGIAKQQVTGADQLLLSIYLYIYPKANADNLCIFIILNGEGVYSQQIVTRRCNDLGITRKRSSKESYNAFSAASIQKVLWFRSEPPPLGIGGIQLYLFMNIDGTEFCLKSIVKSTVEATKQ